jgi:hypothetical protein
MKTIKKLLPLVTLIASCDFIPSQRFALGTPEEKAANPPLENLHLEQIIKQSEKHQVLVAVIDSGIDYNHKRLAPHLRINRAGTGIGLDILGNDAWPHPVIIDPENGKPIYDVFGEQEHGTHVSGLATLGGKLPLGPNGEKINIKPLIGLIPVRAIPLDDYGLEDPKIESTEPGDELLVALRTKSFVEEFAIKKITAQLKEAIDYSHQEGAHIVNMSLGINGDDFFDKNSDLLEAIMEKDIIPHFTTTWKNILFVSAAGNESIKVNTRYYPASIQAPNTISVGALESRGVIADYSNNGDLVDVYINGSDINSLIPGNERTKLSGTSMATPLVTNLAIKIKLLAPCASANDLKTIIIETADTQVLPVAPPKEIPVDSMQKDVTPKMLSVKVVQFKAALERAKSFCSQK